MLSNISPGLILLTIVWVLITAIVIAVSVMTIRGRRSKQNAVAEHDEDGEGTQTYKGSAVGLSQAEAVFLRRLRRVIADDLMVWRNLSSVPSTDGVPATQSNLDSFPTLFSVQESSLSLPELLICVTSPANLKAHEIQVDTLTHQAKQDEVPVLMVDESSPLNDAELHAALVNYLPAHFLSAMPASAEKAPEETAGKTNSGVELESEANTAVIGSPISGQDSEQLLEAPQHEQKKCKNCGTSMSKRKARRGKYEGALLWVCDNFPTCRRAEIIQRASN